jgi:hypothetical protein
MESGPIVGLGTPNSYALVPSEIALADFNGDGRNDVALLNSFSGIDLFLGLSDGGFDFRAVGVDLGGGEYYSGLAAGDLNGDGLADVVLSSSGGVDAGLSLYLQQNDSLSLASTAAAGLGALPVIGGERLASFTDCDVTVFAFNDAGISALTDLPVPCRGGSGLLVDLNGDGLPDLVTGGTFVVYVYLAHGNGTFGAPALVGGSTRGASSMVSGDLNGDGRPDVVEAGNADVSIFLNGCVQ